MEDNKNVSIGVGLSPLVISIKEGKVGDEISLILIEGLTYPYIIWRSGTNHEVPVLPGNKVIFDEPGFYRPVIMGYQQHQSYGINVT